MNYQHIQVFISCQNKSEAKKLVESLLADQIIACAQILPEVESFYRWKGQIVNDQECLLLLKTRHRHFSAIEQLVREGHSYDVPEIIAVPLVDGSTDYLKWIDEQTE
ncbi:divalent-cation tolerance protein CutA [Marinicella sediminis]|uniref:Divalent-cation tolerance protein CutA n=1 Tax=Marinicella sediminis TaxID=1792834 RepID=A0ABV7J9F4_9GAMM|nr:divalent-cation tolerance protein CutA [Marinicella sediminis]